MNDPLCLARFGPWAALEERPDLPLYRIALAEAEAAGDHHKARRWRRVIRLIEAAKENRQCKRKSR